MSSTDGTFIVFHPSRVYMVFQEVCLQLCFVRKPQVTALTREFVRYCRVFTERFSRQFRIVAFGANSSTQLTRVLILKTLRAAMFFFHVLLEFDLFDEGAFTLFTFECMRGLNVLGEKFLLSGSEPFLAVLAHWTVVLTVLSSYVGCQALDILIIIIRFFSIHCFYMLGHLAHVKSFII